MFFYEDGATLECVVSAVARYLLLNLVLPEFSTTGFNEATSDELGGACAKVKINLRALGIPQVFLVGSFGIDITPWHDGRRRRAGTVIFFMDPSLGWNGQVTNFYPPGGWSGPHWKITRESGDIKKFTDWVLLLFSLKNNRPRSLGWHGQAAPPSRPAPSAAPRRHPQERGQGVSCLSPVDGASLQTTPTRARDSYSTDYTCLCPPPSQPGVTGCSLHEHIP